LFYKLQSYQTKSPKGVFVFSLDRKTGVVYNSTVEYWRRMSLETSTERDLVILEHIEQDPDITQADMASQLEVAVGTINWHIKRLIEKGYVKVSRAERKKLIYIITPEGIALRARLTFDYIQNQFNLYRLVRERVCKALEEVKAANVHVVRIEGNGDVAEVCRLTCLEHNIQVSADSALPMLRIVGLKVFFELEDHHES
jgi:DNA-binding MarR family transcriptional regulator